MLDEREAMLDEREAMFDEREAMCVPMHFKVTATFRFGCDNFKTKIQFQNQKIQHLVDHFDWGRVTQLLRLML